MILNFNNGYPDYVGYRQMFVGNGTGPASYVTGGDPTTLQNPRRFIDILFPALTLSQNYFLVPYSAAIGERQVWTVKWLYAKSSLGTLFSEVSSGTNLSAETPEMAGFCGQY
jgi:hypothetical protein